MSVRLLSFTVCLNMIVICKSGMYYSSFIRIHCFKNNGASCLSYLTGCGGDPNQYKPADYQPEPISGVSDNDNQSNPGPTVLPGLMAIGERYIRDDGKMESYLTGEWIDAEIA